MVTYLVFTEKWKVKDDLKWLRRTRTSSRIDRELTANCERLPLRDVQQEVPSMTTAVTRTIH